MHGLEPDELPALLQLASPGLPVGGFSYSSGLESAVTEGWIHDAASAGAWIAAGLSQLWAVNEARLWKWLYRAWAELDPAALQYWNDYLIASRDSRELRLEQLQIGRSLVLWLLALPPPPRLDAARTALLRPVDAGWSQLAAHAAAAWALGLSARGGLYAAGWSLIEAQCSAAVRLVPLGQTAGQQILRALALQLPATVDRVLADESAWPDSVAPLLSVLSARHETQYSRLFRS